MASRSETILILGGGPAGTAMAFRLSELGYEPVLVAAPRTQPAIEGFSERTLRALETLGFTQARDAVGPAVRREVRWAGTASEVNTEFVVDRGGFDVALLRDVSAHGGIQLVNGRAGRIARTTDGWSVTVRCADGSSRQLCANFLVEARGRAAPLPGRSATRGPATVSLARVWEGVTATPRTAVAGFSDGWSWYASTGDGTALLQFMLSAESGEIPKRAALPAFYADVLARAGDARDLMADATPTGPVIARHATPVRANHPLQTGSIRIGDAALGVDPLSGHGVYVALGGAQAAAVTVNTILSRPENRALARSFYEARCALDFPRLCRVGRAFYAQEDRWSARPFWSARSQWPDTLPPYEPMDAFAPRIERRPVVEEGLIVEREVVVTPDHPRGVWVVDGVPLASLLRAARELTRDGAAARRPVAQLARRFNRPAPSVETACAWLKFRKLL